MLPTAEYTVCVEFGVLSRALSKFRLCGAFALLLGDGSLVPRPREQWHHGRITTGSEQDEGKHAEQSGTQSERQSNAAPSALALALAMSSFSPLRTPLPLAALCALSLLSLLPLASAAAVNSTCLTGATPFPLADQCALGFYW